MARTGRLVRDAAVNDETDSISTPSEARMVNIRNVFSQ